MCAHHPGPLRRRPHLSQAALTPAMTGAVKTTCPYCGVGCGVIVENGSVRGDPDHPANCGRLCSKGSALAETLDNSARLLRPRIGGQDAGWGAALELVAQRFAET